MRTPREIINAIAATHGNLFEIVPPLLELRDECVEWILANPSDASVLEQERDESERACVESLYPKCTCGANNDPGACGHHPLCPMKSREG